MVNQKLIQSISLWLFCWLIAGFVYAQPMTERGMKGLTTGDGAASFNHVWALSVGVSKYAASSYSTLNFADDDAIWFDKFIRRAYGQKAVKKDAFQLLTNENATAPNFNKWLSGLKEAQKGDLVVLYFAGHGFLKSIENKPHCYLLFHKTEEGNEGAPGDDNCYLSQLLETTLTELAARGVKVLCILDACHSGTAQISTPVSAITGQNFLTLLACGKDQTSIEDKSFGGGHGAFTWFVVRGLAGEADSDQNGIVQLEELEIYVKSKLLETGRVFKHDQNPLFPNGSSFAFAANLALFQEFRQGSIAPNAEQTAGLTAEQQQIYKNLQAALQAKQLVKPAGRSVRDYFAVLARDATNKDLLAPIAREWMVAFEIPAQTLIDRYYDGKLENSERYAEAAGLLAESLKYPQFIAANRLNELTARQAFLRAYAFFCQYLENKQTLDESERNNRFRGLISDLESAAGLSQAPAYIYNVIGLFWHELNDKEKAEQYYHRARELAPTWAIPINNLAGLIEDSRQRINQYEQAKGFYVALMNIVREYKTLKEYDKAREYLQKALKSAANDSAKVADIYKQYGLIYQEEGESNSANYDKAIESYQKAAQWARSNRSIRQGLDLELTRLYLQMKAYDKAAETFDRYIEQEEQIVTRQYNELYRHYRSLLTEQRGEYFYRIGYCYEKGYGVARSDAEARRWYQFAANMNFNMAVAKLTHLYTAVGANDALKRLRKNQEKGYLSCTASCRKTDGTLATFTVYLHDFVANSKNPVSEEQDRIQQAFGAKISEDALSAFLKVYELAQKHNVSFQDLMKFVINENEKSQVKVAEGKAFEFAKAEQPDSVMRYMRKAVLGLDIDLSSEVKSSQKLLDSLRAGTSRPGLFYYALGYLYENKTSGREWGGKAEKWYNYAFQTGYAPAYFPLMKHYKALSMTSFTTWLTDNYNRGVEAKQVKCTLENGKEQWYPLYLVDFPANPSNPIADEASRLKDVYGAKVATKLASAFKTIYETAQRERRSFIEQCRLSLNITPEREKKASSAAEQHARRGDELYEERKYADAVGPYQQAVNAATSPADRAIYYSRLGNAYLMSNQEDKALNSYRTSIALSPTGQAYYNMGYVLEYLRKQKDAIAAYRKAVELESTVALYHRGLASAYSSAGQYELAAQSARATLAIEPTDTRAMNTLGISLTYLKRYDEALKQFARAIELNPSQESTYLYNIACNYSLQNRQADALLYLEKAINRGYKDHEAIMKDLDFTSIRQSDGFRRLMARYFPGK
ncbi:DUF2610 domain-containing protein [Spirosoma linguale]